MAGLVDSYRIQKPFADRGDKTVVPQVDITTNFVNFDMGYTIDYEREIGTTENAKAVERRKQNWMFNSITANIKQWQEQGFPQWYKTVKYMVGSCIRYVSYTDPTGNVTGDDKVYRCLSNNVPIGMRPSGDGASATWWEVVPGVAEILNSIPMPAGGGVPDRELVTATSGVDFNYTNTLGGTRRPGTWEMASDAVAIAALNCPSRLAGMLESKEWTVGTGVCRVQRYTDRSGECWFRAFGGTNWSSWRTFVSPTTTLASYGIGDAVSSTKSSGDNMIPDASIVDARWETELAAGMTMTKVAVEGMPAAYAWRTTGTSSGTVSPAYAVLSKSNLGLSLIPVIPGGWLDLSCYVQFDTGATGGAGVDLNWINTRTNTIVGSNYGLYHYVGGSTVFGSPFKISGTLKVPAGANACRLLYVRKAVPGTNVSTGGVYIGGAYMRPSTRADFVNITAAGFDFNDLTEANIYVIRDNTWARTAGNSPSSSLAMAGTLYVTKHVDRNVVVQMYVDIYGQMWCRGSDVGNWNPWRFQINGTGDQTINGGLAITGTLRVGNGVMELGNQTGTPGPAYVDFHTDGTTKDYNARIMVSTNSKDIQLFPHDPGNAANGYVRVMTPNSSRSMDLLADPSAASRLILRYFGATGRANVFEAKVDSKVLFIAEQGTNGGDDIKFTIPGVLNVSGDANVTGKVTATDELVTLGKMARLYGNPAGAGAQISMLLRNNGDASYWLVTNPGDQSGSYNNLRPIVVNNTTGRVTMQHGLGVTGEISSTTAVKSATMTATGDINAASFNASSDLNANRNATVAGVVKAGGELQSYSGATSANQMLRLSSNGQSTMLCNHSNGNSYLFVTDQGSPNATWNGLRPFWFSRATGLVHMENGVEIKGNTNMIGDLSVVNLSVSKGFSVKESLAADLDVTAGRNMTTGTGYMRAGGELQTTSGKLRLVAGSGSASRGIIFGNYADSNNFNITTTDANNPYGDANALRPLSINLLTGNVNLRNGLSVTGDAVATGNVTGVKLAGSDTVFGKNAVTTDGTMYAKGNIQSDMVIKSVGELQTTASQLRVIGGGRGAILRNDGSSTYLLVTAAGDPYGPYNGFRPISFNNTTGDVTMGRTYVASHIDVNGSIKSYGANAGVYSGDALLASDGNISGSAWGNVQNNYLSTYIRIVADNARQAAQNWAYQNMVQSVRMSGRNVIPDTGDRIDLPSGAVYTGMSGANYNPSIWAAWSAIQVLINGSWITISTQ